MPQKSGSPYPLSHELFAAAAEARERGDLIASARLAGDAHEAYQQEWDEVNQRRRGPVRER
jgi:hypothetical protein